MFGSKSLQRKDIFVNYEYCNLIIIFLFQLIFIGINYIFIYVLSYSYIKTQINTSIDAIFLKADEHVGTAEYFFGVFKKRYECLFATFWQRPSKRKVESATCNHGFPHNQSLFSKLEFKTQMCTSVLCRTHHLFLLL